MRSSGSLPLLRAAAAVVSRQQARARQEHRRHAIRTARRGGCWRVPSRERLTRVFRYVLDENEFLSPHGMRSLSRVYEAHPYVARSRGAALRDSLRARRVRHRDSSAETRTGAGPVWMPLNYLLIEALKRHHHFYGDSLRVECPARLRAAGCTLLEVAEEIERRIASLFLPDARGPAALPRRYPSLSE